MSAVRALVAVAAVGLGGAAAAQQPPALYGVAHIANDSTARCTVYYKWGKDGAWKKGVIETGKKHYFSWAYDGANKSSPDLYVRIDVETDGDTKWVEHTLSRGQSPDKDSAKYGHHYSVRQLKGTDTRYIEAVTKGAKVTVTDARSTAPAVK